MESSQYSPSSPHGKEQQGKGAQYGSPYGSQYGSQSGPQQDSQYGPPYRPHAGPQMEQQRGPQYPSYVHPGPRRPSPLSGIFHPVLVLVGVGIAALLMFVGMALVQFTTYYTMGKFLVGFGAAGGFVIAFGGAFVGRKFDHEQRNGLYLAAAAFLICLTLVALFPTFTTL